MVSALQTEILSLNPPLYWPCGDASGAASLANAGTVGAGANATKVAGAGTGFVSLTADQIGTSAFNPGIGTNEGWNAGIQASLNIGAADSFTAFGVLQVFTPPSRNIVLASQGLTGTFGGWYIALDAQGNSHWAISDTSSHVLDVAIPPLVANGLPHCMAIVRDTSTHVFEAYLDGALVFSLADPTAGIAITHANSNCRVGNWDQQTLGFLGLYSHVFMIKSVVAGLEQAVLYNKLWNGNPPTPATSFQVFVETQITAMTVDLSEILAAVKKVY